MATRNGVSCVLPVIGILSLLCYAGSSSYVSDEDKLRSALFSNYNVKIKPSQKVDVNIVSYLGALISMDTAAQTMSILLLLNIIWNDERLAWNSTDYGNITLLATAPEDIWTPSLVVENAIDSVGVLGGNSRDGVPLGIYSTGTVVWLPPQAITTSCEMSIVHYPFDTQQCSVVIVPWTYPMSHMELIPLYIDTEFIYSANGEFDLVKTDTALMTLPGPSDDLVFQKVRLEFSFRRKWQFYGQNLLLPIVLNSVLMLAVFLLPIESGEKMGYSITVLLSYVVFLTWVSENLPSVSSGTSILQLYLAVVLGLGCLSTLLTTLVLRLYHTDPKKPVTGFYHTFAANILAPFNRCLRCRAKRRVRHADQEGKAVTAADKDPRMMTQELFAISDNGGNGKNVQEENDDMGIKTEPPVYTRQMIAGLLDYFLLWVFTLLLLIVTFVILYLMYVNY